MQPASPDPYETADAQAGANRDASISGALINNVNQSNPYGSVTYNQIGTTTYKDAQGKDVTVPKFEAVTTLSPEQQKLYNQQVAAGTKLNDLGISQIDRLSTTLNKPLDLSGLPKAVNSVSLKNDANGLGYTGPAVDTSALSVEKAGSVTGAGQGIQSSVGAQDWSADRTKVEEALYSRLNPQFEQDEAALRQRLANQGLTPGSEAYNRELTLLSQSKNDARMQAVLAGGQEQTRLADLALAQGNFANAAQAQAFGQQYSAQDQANAAANQNNNAAIAAQQARNAAQNQAFGQNAAAQQFEREGISMANQNALTTANFANTARQNALTEQLTARNQPINEISALLSGGQVQVPQFQAPYQQSVGASDISGQINQAYQNELNAYNNSMSGLFGLGGTLLSGLFRLSERSEKTDAVRIGYTDAGLPVWRFRYKRGGPMQLGVMADEVEKVRPEAVVRIGGKRHVNYAMVQ